MFSGFEELQGEKFVTGVQGIEAENSPGFPAAGTEPDLKPRNRGLERKARSCFLNLYSKNRMHHDGIVWKRNS